MFLSWFLLLLLFSVPVVIAALFHLRLQRKYFLAVGKMAISMLAAWLLLGFLIQQDAVVLNLICLLVVVALASFMVVHRARWKVRYHFVPVLIATLCVSVLVSMVAVCAVSPMGDLLSARYFLPMLGFCVGGILESNGKALDTYYMGLYHHHALYDYLLGNGVSHPRAVRFFMKRAITCSLLPSIGHMSYIAVSTTPMVLWTMLLAGASVYDAVFVQLIAIATMLAAAPLALIFSLFLTRHYAFDAYGRLLPKEKIVEDEEEA